MKNADFPYCSPAGGGGAIRIRIGKKTAQKTVSNFESCFFMLKHIGDGFAHMNGNIKADDSHFYHSIVT